MIRTIGELEPQPCQNVTENFIKELANCGVRNLKEIYLSVVFLIRLGSSKT